MAQPSFNGFLKPRPDAKKSGFSNDTNDYPNYNILTGTNATLISGTTTLLNITNKHGYLSKAFSINSAATHGLKITIDGVIIFNSQSNAVNVITGILNGVDMGFPSAVSPVLRTPATVSANISTNPTMLILPFTAGTQGATEINVPIFFSNSLLIEITSSSSTGYYYEIQYATN